MRQDGFDEATIRAAFEEVMGNSDGSFRKPLRRVLKTDSMQAMPTQAEINKMYEDRYAGVVDTEVADKSVAMILERMKQTKELKLSAQKPTLRQRLYRIAFFFLRRPLRFGIAFLKALQDGQ